MISSSTDLRKLLYSSNSININSGCTIEYNMNNMLDNITATTVSTDQDYKDGVESIAGTTVKLNAYKKLFPVDSIIKPFRPLRSGAKYYLLLPLDLSAAPFDSYTKISYTTGGKARVYYAGLTNSYKYWVSPIGQKADVTITYSQSEVPISSAYSTGPIDQNKPDEADIREEVFFKTSVPHGLTSNLNVSITGFTNNDFNLTNKPIKRIVSETEFVLSSNIAVASESGGGLRKLQIVTGPDSGTATATKPALANKIFVKFEKTHLLPTTTTITITYSSGSSPSPIVVQNAAYATDGALTLYWNGSTWSTTVPSEPRTYAAPKEIKSIRVETSAATAGRVIAITEISARWEKDLSSDLISFTIQKESSISEDNILPVGTITANSLQMNLVKFNQNELKILEYDRSENWNSTPTDIIYLYKDAMLMPHFKIYYPQGSISDGSSRYDIVNQGTFYMDTFSISEYGQSEITSLDGAKYLQQIIPTGLHLQNCPMSSVIACMLDSIGFTNYNFNVTSNEDTSIPQIVSWWTDESKTAWDYLQEICRDAQINAFFDESNILQFYSRDKIYNETNVSWKFFESLGNSITIGSESITASPSIINFSKNEIPSANQVRVKWAPPISSVYNQEDTKESLWSSSPLFIFAGALQTNISATEEPQNINFKLSKGPGEFPILSSFNFSGYFLINSEIFEYDAIQYAYQDLSDGIQKTEWVRSKAELDAIRSISYQDVAKFYPTGKYRIIKRGVFGTPKQIHYPASSTQSGWTPNDVTWDAI